MNDEQKETIAKAVADAYHDGYRDGYQKGFDQGRSETHEIYGRDFRAKAHGVMAVSALSSGDKT